MSGAPGWNTLAGAMNEPLVALALLPARSVAVADMVYVVPPVSPVTRTSCFVPTTRRPA